MAYIRSDRMETVRHELFGALSVAVADIVSTAVPGLEAAAADQIGHAVADWLAKEWGGSQLSIPKDWRWRLSQRDREVWDAYKGDNVLALSRQYGTTERHIYRIIDRVRAVIKAEREPQLF